MRAARSLAAARLAVLEQFGYSLGLMTGPRTSGPKPHHMDDAMSEFQLANICLATARLLDEHSASQVRAGGRNTGDLAGQEREETARRGPTE